jgi:hypothetical protein
MSFWNRFATILEEPTVQPWERERLLLIARKRLLLIAGASMCVLIAYIGTNVVMASAARWVEVEQGGYLWSQEEWMQLFEADNFVGRGRGRILLAGSSEVREGFLVDEFEAELTEFDVYNNAFSNHTLETLIVVLQYLETAYGPSAMPQKIVLGVTLPFLLDVPPINSNRSYLAGVIDRYSPFVSLDVASRPGRLVRKGWLESLVSRYRYLTHQSRRYRGAVRGVMRWGVLTVAPGLTDRPRLQFGLVPSRNHHRPPIDQREQLQAMRRVLPPPPDPVALEGTVRMQWAMLVDFVANHHIDLYVVNMPQSTFLLNDYYVEMYGDYERLLRSVVGDVPYLDLARSVRDDEFYDVTHLNLGAARRTSRRVAQFVRKTEVAEP